MDPNIKQVVIKCPEGYEVDYEHSTFEYIKFKKIEKQLPKTWEEFCKTHPRKAGEAFISLSADIQTLAINNVSRHPECDKKILPSKEYAEAMLALCQLIQLRDCYNDGWEPDWENVNEFKHTIYLPFGKIARGTHNLTSYVLSFKTKELRDEFLKNFKDLIKTAKPLL